MAQCFQLMTVLCKKKIEIQQLMVNGKSLGITHLMYVFYLAFLTLDVSSHHCLLSREKKFLTILIRLFHISNESGLVVFYMACSRFDSFRQCYDVLC